MYMNHPDGNPATGVIPSPLTPWPYRPAPVALALSVHMWPLAVSSYTYGPWSYAARWYK